MSWLKILDIDLLIQKSLEKEELAEKNLEEADDDTYKILNKYESYQEKNIDIQNFMK